MTDDSNAAAQIVELDDWRGTMLAQVRRIIRMLSPM